MMKISCYDSSLLNSYEIDGIPHATMGQILSLAIPGSWDDYVQVLHSSDDLVYDLGVKCVDGIWLIPVTQVSAWLYTFSLRNMRGERYDRFRVFRRDIEKTLRVAWALPVDDLVLQDYQAPYIQGDYTLVDIANVFLSYGLRDEEVECLYGIEDITPLEYIEYISCCTSCGPRGYLLGEQIEYIDNLPNGNLIIEHINETLHNYLVPPTEYLDDYLDDINTFISLEATRFVGEL